MSESAAEDIDILAETANLPALEEPDTSIAHDQSAADLHEQLDTSIVHDQNAADLDAEPDTSIAHDQNTADGDAELLQDRLMELIQLASSMSEQLAEVSDAVSVLVAQQKRAARDGAATRKRKKRTTKRRTTGK